MSEVNSNNEANAQAMIHRILSEIVDSKDPQALWRFLRSIVTMDKEMPKSELLRDVEAFCLAVFDCLEPNILQAVREQRRIHVGVLAISLNLRIAEAGRRLAAKDNAFLVKWGIVTGTSMIALRQLNANVELVLSPFCTFDHELQMVDQPELVLAVWLYSLYSTIYTSAFGTIPAGVLCIASLGMGLAMAGR